MDTLNQVVSKYLVENGISVRFFARYIGSEYTKCLKWIKGKEDKKLSSRQIERTHMFLNGQFLRTVDEIIKEG